MKKSFATIFVLLALCSSVAAQDNITAITYQASVPNGDFADYIGKTSWIGWGLEGKRFRSPSSNVTFGFAFAWHVFDDRLTGTQEFEHGALTGTQRRFTNSLPFLLTGDYYLSRKSGLKPFIGAGIGAYYIVQRIDVGVYSKEESNWHFGVAPEAGIQVPLGDAEALFSVKYHYALEAGTSVSGEAAEFRYLSFIIGLAYSRW